MIVRDGYAYIPGKRYDGENERQFYFEEDGTRVVVVPENHYTLFSKLGHELKRSQACRKVVAPPSAKPTEAATARRRGRTDESTQD